MYNCVCGEPWCQKTLVCLENDLLPNIGRAGLGWAVYFCHRGPAHLNPKLTKIPASLLGGVKKQQIPFCPVESFNSHQNTFHCVNSENSELSGGSEPVKTSESKEPGDTTEKKCTWCTQ